MLFGETVAVYCETIIEAIRIMGDIRINVANSINDAIRITEAIRIIEAVRSIGAIRITESISIIEAIRLNNLDYRSETDLRDNLDYPGGPVIEATRII
jgi:hypothetical protein